MDKDLIERLAREAGAVEGRTGNLALLWSADVERFAALIAEECAKVANIVDASVSGKCYASDAADAIRAKLCEKP